MRQYKKIIITIMCVIFLTVLYSPTSISYQKDDIINNVDIENESANFNPFLHMSKIDGGFGITVKIDNLGDEVEQNIHLDVFVQGGIFVIVPKKHFQVNEIQPHDSETILISLFGLGFGDLTEYPQITLSLSSSNFKGTYCTLTTRLFGSYCTILGEFFNYPCSFQGYTLFSPEYSKYTYLMDNNAEIVHEWKSEYIQGLPVYLDEQGNLIRACSKLNNPVFMSGGFTGRVEIRDWNNTLKWEFDYSTDQYCMHHDVEVLPNGNILLVAWEYKVGEEAIEMGRNPKKLMGDALWPDHIIEVKPIGNNQGEIVWQWHVWDHLIQDYDVTKQNYGIVRNHPERIDINYGNDNPDWTHINSVDYNPFLDQIILSVHNFNEIWVIDHSTTTQQAAGHSGGRYNKGGDILYRWGNPQTYGMGTKQDKKLFGQHDAQWIEPGCPGAGNILIFNNGVGRPNGQYSSVDEIIPPVTMNGEYIIDPGSSFGPENQIWKYVSNPPSDFHSGHISGTQRLPNGNTLICEGDDGHFFEVTKEKHIVWNYVNVLPDMFNNHVFKIQRYPLDYPGVRFF